MDDVITELTDGGTVGDEDHGLVMTVVEEADEELALGLFVKRRADFVEKENATRT